MKKKQFGYYRYPRTTQEKRANQGKQDPLVRPSRRSNGLPTSYDDLQKCHQKSWKVRRKKQYREDKTGFGWFYIDPEHPGWPRLRCINWNELNRVCDDCDRLGYYHDYDKGIFRWYGTELIRCE